MVFRPESRWWIVTLAIIAVLVAISAIALDRPNVVWHGEKPHCPSCRSVVAFYSSKCPRCTTPFDWVVAPDDASPRSAYSLSAIAAEQLLRTVNALGIDEATARVARVTGFSDEDARAYLDRIGRGRCGWCGGTGLELPTSTERADPACSLCLGSGACVACGGDQRQRLGVWGAEQALERYTRALAPLRGANLPPDVEAKEAWRLAHEFLRDHAGTVQATRLLVPAIHPSTGTLQYVPAPKRARDRLDIILAALRAKPPGG